MSVDGTSTKAAVPVLDGEAARRAARALARRAALGAVERDRTGAHPIAELREAADKGLLAITVPAAHGGAGLGVGVVVDVVRTLSAADPSLAQLFLPQYVNVFFLDRAADAAQQRRYLGAILAGARFGNATVDAKVGATTVLPDGDEVVIDGAKYYSTGTFGADYTAFAIAGAEGGPAAAYIPVPSPGLTVSADDWKAFGQRATISGSVIADGVRAERAAIVELGTLFAPGGLFPAVDHLQHAAVDVGIARAALDDAAWFITNRARPWFEAGVESADQDPHVIHRFGQLATRVEALEALLSASAATVDEVLASAAPTEDDVARAVAAASGAKAFANDVAVETASAVFELTGTSSTDDGFAFDRHWRNARVHSVNVPTRWRYHAVGRDALRRSAAASLWGAVLDGARAELGGAGR